FKKIFYYLVEAIALQFGSYNVTVNNYYLRYYKLFFWKKSLRIYNGVDFSAIERSLTNKGEKNPDERTVKKILFVGRLDKQKNPLTALRAFKYLIQKNSNVIFDVVGDGELRKECETYVIENNLESKV
ncbi:glycosyltransferase, partial [Escherichia coli]